MILFVDSILSWDDNEERQASQNRHVDDILTSDFNRNQKDCEDYRVLDGSPATSAIVAEPEEDLKF